MGNSRKAKTVLKAIEILEELSNSEQGISNAELSRRLNLHPSTTYRLLDTLVGKDYVKKENGLYQVGYKILELKYLAHWEVNLRQRARSWLTDLENRTGFTTNLAIRDGLCAIPIEIIKGSKNLVVNNNLGKSVPLYATSVGKCLLSFLPASDWEELVVRLNLESLTPRTITDSDELFGELRLTRERGYAVDNEEFVTGIRCIGAPIFSYGGQVIAAVSIAGLASQIEDDTIDKLAKDVIQAGERISSHHLHVERRCIS